MSKLSSMIQSKLQLDYQIKQINENCKFPGQIQKIYTSARYLAFAVRTPGKSQTLYLGRGKGYEGIWSAEENLPSELRTKDRFLDYLRKHLTSVHILSIRYDVDDRIILFEYQYFKKKNHFYYFWSGREAYFGLVYYDEKKNEYELKMSWGLTEKHSEIKDNYFDYFNEVGRKKLKKSEMKPITTIKILLEEEKNELAKADPKEQKKEKKKIAKIQMELDKIKAISEWGKIISPIDGADFEKLDKFKHGNIELKLKGKTGHQKKSQLFQKIKDYQKAYQIQAKRLEGMLTIKEKPLENELEVIMPIWKNTTKVREQKSEYKIVEYQAQGFTIYVGKDAAANDHMRSKLAKADDIWFHPQHIPGPHIIVKLKGDYRLKLEDYQIIGSIMMEALDITKQTQFFDLMYTEVKNLKAIKGKAGSVNYKKQKYICVEYLKNWQSFLSA
ncbi:MAG: DUF814 domain-containing protein [Bacteriovoracaceae bacterium]|nr:DUF814 domain-containing protein [Bacteriovoracaceae bacterium]